MNSRYWKLGALVILLTACSPKTHQSTVGKSLPATTTRATPGPTGGASPTPLAVYHVASPKAHPAGHVVSGGTTVRHPAVARSAHKIPRTSAEASRPATVARQPRRSATSGQPSVRPTAAPAVASAAQGDKLYHGAGASGTGCVACHGPQGTGIGGIDLRGKTAADIATAMTMQPMASMGFHLSPRNEADLAAYLATLK